MPELLNQFEQPGIRVLNYEEDLPTTTKCEACKGEGEVYEDAPWLCSPTPCEDCDGTGKVERNWLQEALQIVSGSRRWDTPRREHLVALATHYRECLTVFSGSEVPAALDRVTQKLYAIADTCRELAGKEAA